MWRVCQQPIVQNALNANIRSYIHTIWVYFFSNSAAFSLLCMLHCTTHTCRCLTLVVCTILLSYYAPIICNEPILLHVLPKPQASKNAFVSFEVYSIVFSAQLIFGLIWVSQSIPTITSALSSGTIQHQTICVVPEANTILSLANLVLSI